MSATPGEQDMVSSLDTLQRHMFRRVGDKLYKDLGPLVAGILLGNQWFGACYIMPPIIEDTTLYLLSRTIKKEAQHLVGLFRL